MSLIITGFSLFIFVGIFKTSFAFHSNKIKISTTPSSLTDFHLRTYVRQPSRQLLTQLNEQSSILSTEFKELEKVLYREYSSFFSPMEKKYYNNDVKFIDPLSALTGIDAYANNVNMLAGRTALGKIMFEDALIQLHKIEQIESNKIQTRWTLKVTLKLLPWKPRAKFTGVSVYTLDKNNSNKIIQQDDYWDSINLNKGSYSHVSRFDGISDFLNELKQDNTAEMVAPELPYELLRRAKRYEVRRYPATIVAETTYEQRPQGYDRLGSYASGSNVNTAKVTYLSPTLMRITNTATNTATATGTGTSDTSDTNTRIKYMSWPLVYALPNKNLPALSTFPEATIDSVKIKESPSVTVAVTRFDVAATEPVVRGYTEQLRRDVLADGIIPTKDVENGTVIVGQYDALFSLNKRRNEVWIELEKHPWLI